MVEKAKIAEEVKRTERLNREKKRGRNKRETETPGVGQMLMDRAKVNRPDRAGPPAVNPGVPLCADCVNGHVGEC